MRALSAVVSVPTPDPEPESLAALIQRRLHELGDESGPLSLRRAAQKSSGLLSSETLRRASLGMAETSDKALRGLSLALEVPVAEVYRAAGVPRPWGRWELPPEFDRMPPKNRVQFEVLMSAFLEALESDRP